MHAFSLFQTASDGIFLTPPDLMRVTLGTKHRRKCGWIGDLGFVTERAMEDTDASHCIPFLVHCPIFNTALHGM